MLTLLPPKMCQPKNIILLLTRRNYELSRLVKFRSQQNLDVNDQISIQPYDPLTLSVGLNSIWVSNLPLESVSALKLLTLHPDPLK